MKIQSLTRSFFRADLGASVSAEARLISHERRTRNRARKVSGTLEGTRSAVLNQFFQYRILFPQLLVLFFDMQSVIFDNITQILCKCSCFCIKCCYKVIAHSRALQKHFAFIVPNDTNWPFQVQLTFPCAQPAVVVSRVVTPPKNFLRKKLMGDKDSQPRQIFHLFLT